VSFILDGRRARSARGLAERMKFDCEEKRRSERTMDFLVETEKLANHARTRPVHYDD